MCCIKRYSTSLLLAVKARIFRVLTDVSARYALPMEIPRRPKTLTAAEESIIVDVILYYAKINTPLSRWRVLDLVEEIITLLPSDRRRGVGFVSERPSKNCIDHFIKQHSPKFLPVQVLQGAAVTASSILKHIARDQTAFGRYSINNAKHLFNTDQSAAYFAKMTGQSMRKCVGRKNMQLVLIEARTKGNLERLALMPMVSADGALYKPVLVLTEIFSHFRKMNSVHQTLHSVSPPCYLFQRESSGVDASIVHEWANEFSAVAQNPSGDASFRQQF